MNALNLAAREAMRDRIAAYLWQEHAPALDDFDAVELAAFVDRAIEAAARYGFTNERDIAWLAAVRLEVGPRFDEQPRIHAILADPSLAADAKIGRVLDDVADDDWTEAETLR